MEGKSNKKELTKRFHQVHEVHFRVGVANAWEECQLKWIVIMAISYLFGTYLYATQTPEVKRPGKFDLIGKKPKRFIIVFQDLRTIFSMSSLLEE